MGLRLPNIAVKKFKGHLCSFRLFVANFRYFQKEGGMMAPVRQHRQVTAALIVSALTRTMTAAERLEFARSLALSIKDSALWPEVSALAQDVQNHALRLTRTAFDQEC